MWTYMPIFVSVAEKNESLYKTFLPDEESAPTFDRPKQMFTMQPQKLHDLMRCNT